MILAVDTSLGTAVARIDVDGRELASAVASDPLGHAEVIGDLLSDVAPPGAAITHVVSGMGPGPFTGLRIGIAAARAFALGRGLPVVPVPTHFGAALEVIEADAAPGVFAIITDARRREVAITVFDGLDDDGIPQVARETVLVKRVDAEAHLGGMRAIEVTALSGAALARVGARAVASGRTLADGEPLYLRQPDVTMPGAPKKVGT